MKNENSEPISSIHEASIGKRLLAAILDFVLGIFLWLFFSMIVMTPIADKTLHYSEFMQKGLDYQVASHLYVYEQQNDQGNYDIIEVKDFTEKINLNRDSKINSLVNKTELDPNYYLTHVYYYYTSFLTGVGVEMPNDTDKKKYDMEADGFVAPSYKENVKGTDILPKDYYTTKWFNTEILKIGGDGDKYFNCPDINVLATTKTFELKEDLDNFRNYMRNLCNNAAGDLFYRDFYAHINNNLKGIQVFIVIPPYVLTMCLLYLVVPLCFKNGETLAKKFCHLALVNKNGYSIKKRQTIFRFAVFFLWISISLFVVGIGFTSFATLGIGILIMLVATLISKTHRAPHDYAAMTLEIDTLKSVWFDSLEEETKHQKELEEKMNRYKSNKVENKNIIQIGDQIIDEKIKKEVEESRSLDKKQNK